jgi:hypothetical protein
MESVAIQAQHIVGYGLPLRAVEAHPDLLLQLVLVPSLKPPTDSGAGLLVSQCDVLTHRFVQVPCRR